MQFDAGKERWRSVQVSVRQKTEVLKVKVEVTVKEMSDY